jgi:dolichol-phosphate mannosyltransferase
LETQHIESEEHPLEKNNLEPHGKMAIIPSCNNTEQLVKVLAAFTGKIVDEICVIIDAPTKNELKFIESTAKRILIPVHLIKNDVRKGVGFAIREGINYALEMNYQIVVILAGNGKDQPIEIPRLLSPLFSGKYDYVQGSRFLRGGQAVKNPFFRKIFSRLFPLPWTLLTKFKCTDVTNGFRAYKLSIFRDRQINIWQSWLDNYELEYYLHYKVITLGYEVKEVPVSKIYPYSHKGGYSNIQPLKDWWKIISPLIYLKTGIRQ